MVRQNSVKYLARSLTYLFRACSDLHVALNYGQGTGSGQILRFATEHTEVIAFPPILNVTN